jgi:hypothetical protein
VAAAGGRRRTHALSARHRAAPRRKKATRISRVVGVGLVTSKHRHRTHPVPVKSVGVGCSVSSALAHRAHHQHQSSVDTSMAHEVDVCEQIFRAIRDADLPTARQLLDQGMWNINARARRTLFIVRRFASRVLAF